MTAKEEIANKQLSHQIQQTKNIQYVLLPASTDLQALRVQLFQPTSNSLSTGPIVAKDCQQVYFSTQIAANADSRTQTQSEKTQLFTNVSSSHQLEGFVNATPSIQQPDSYYEPNNVSGTSANSTNMSAFANICPAQNDQLATQYGAQKVAPSSTTSESKLRNVDKILQSDAAGEDTAELCFLDNHSNVLMDKVNILKVKLFITNNGCATFLSKFQLCFVQKQRRFCDLKIKIGKVEFNCHSVVMAAMSSVIHDLLITEASSVMRQMVIALPTLLNVQIFSELMDALYTGQVRLRKDSVKQMLLICAYLKISNIQSKCEEYCKTVFGDCTEELTKISSDAQKMPPPYIISNEVNSKANENVQTDLEVESESLQDSDNNTTQDTPIEPTSLCLAMSDQSKPRPSLTNLVRVASEAYKDLDQENEVSYEGNGEEIEMVCSQSANDDTDDATSDDKTKDNNWCNKCEKQFTSSKRFSNHMKLAHSGNRHKCGFCHKTFKKTSDKLLHERRMHTKEKPLKCKTCGKSFCLKRELNHHMKMHAGKDQSCPICRKIFRSVDGLKHHIAAHGEKKYVCRNSPCQRVFATIMLRNRHERSHSSVKPFACDECNYSFKLNHELTRHKIKHTGEKQFKCVKCSRSFGRAEHLKGHMLSHSDVRNFKCDICNKTFKQKSGLSVHKLKHDAPFNYVCDVCGYKCHSKANLQLHSVTHLNERPFQCKICSAFFKAKKYLNRHLKIHEKKGETTAEKYNEVKNAKKSISFDVTTKLKNSQVIYPKSHQAEKSQKKILPKITNVSSNLKLVQPSSYYMSQPMFPPSATVLPSLQEAFRTGTRTTLNMGPELGVAARLIRMPQKVQVDKHLLEFSNNIVIGPVMQSENVYGKNMSEDCNLQKIANWQCHSQTAVSGSSTQLPHENIPVLSADDFLQ